MDPESEESRLMREGLPTFILTIQEYREFKILNSLVQGSDTSPADAVEKIAKITVEMRDTQLRGDHLWYTCVSVIELAQRTPPEHQTRLVEFIVLLSQTSVMDPETGKHMMHHGDLVWTGLPSLGYTAADEWYAFDAMRPDNTPEACRRWLNLIGFFARTSAAEMPQVDFSFYSLLAFDEAFRVALPGEVAVRTACMWMIWDATRLWKHVEKGTKIGDWPIMTRKMWYSWELGLERVREWAGRELRGPVDEALAAQRSAERGKSLI